MEYVFCISASDFGSFNAFVSQFLYQLDVIFAHLIDNMFKDDIELVLKKRDTSGVVKGISYPISTQNTVRLL